MQSATSTARSGASKGLSAAGSAADRRSVGGRGAASVAIASAKSAAGLLCVSPPVVEFHGVTPGSVYGITVRIANVSKQSLRVRIQPPTSSRFKVNFEKGGAIAPGLEVTAEIEFKCDEAKVRRGTCYITSGALHVIPGCACGCAACVACTRRLMTKLPL